MRAAEKRIIQRKRRKKHVRKKMVGSPERPRLTVSRSHNNIYAQIIDDEAGRTLVSVSTREKTMASSLEGFAGNKAAAARVGEAIAAKAGEKGIKKVVFDRNGYVYHGRIRELAEAARKGGLEF